MLILSGDHVLRAVAPATQVLVLLRYSWYVFLRLAFFHVFHQAPALGTLSLISKLILLSQEVVSPVYFYNVLLVF